MSDLETIYNDKRAWTFFKGADETETVGVYRRCPECSRYLKNGDLLMNIAGDIRLEGWECKKHGSVQPYYDREC